MLQNLGLSNLEYELCVFECRKIPLDTAIKTLESDTNLRDGVYCKP